MMANTESEEPASAMDEAKDEGILSGTNLEHDEAEVTAPVSSAAGSSAPGSLAPQATSIPGGSNVTAPVALAAGSSAPGVAAGSSASQATAIPGGSNDIGPYCTAMDLHRDLFTGQEDLPTVEKLQNGLVVELYDFLKENRMSNMGIARILIKLGGVSANDHKVCNYVKEVVTKYKHIKKNAKGIVQVQKLSSLLDKEFLVLRSKQLKEPDTPRKKKMRAQIAEIKTDNKGVKRKLAGMEGTIEDQRHRLEFLEEELDMRKARQKEIADFSTLQDSFVFLCKKMKQITAEFDPTCQELNAYKKKYEEKEKELLELEKKLVACQGKLQKVNARNVNKRIKRRDESITKLKDDNSELSTLVKELKEDLEQNRNQLSSSKDRVQSMEAHSKHINQSRRKVYDQARYLRRRHTSGADVQDLMDLKERVSFLEKREKELEEVIGLMEDNTIMTFENGRYNDCIRKTIMELLAQNVSLRKVTSVIRTVIKNLTGKNIGRLPSAGTVSRLAVEANHLATIEVALAMKSATPEKALGNCIHGDGTTKHHRKYQNFQVTLPDGTSRTMGLVEMAAGDTEAVMDAFKDRINTLASSLAQLEGGNQEDMYKELVTTVKSTMTDQGATMPQFNDRLRALRQDLLPQVVKQWNQLPGDVQACVSDFGKFFCKMHPLINFAEEVDKALKAFEDITTSGRHAHTLQTSESGATRLIRISSKAFHHRGCDKSGVEDVFSAFLSNACGTKNHLVDYIGNRANILFEGASALYFHVPHIQEFLSMIQNRNNLLLAIEEDINEKLLVAEIRALGIFYIAAIKPLWERIISSGNIFDTNEPLHQLQTKLMVWKEDASPLLAGDSPFNISTGDDISKKLLDSTDAEAEMLTTQALELISCAVLLILQRQCKDQLPGGKYWDLADDVKAAYHNVPSTNMIGERDFAQLDLLVRKKPSARITTLEALIMWTNNKMPEWLDSLSEKERGKYMKAARQCSDDVLRRYAERKKAIKQQKWEALQKASQKRKDLEEKRMKSTADLVNEVVELGGVWTSEQKITEMVGDIESTKSDEQIRRILYTQLLFLQKVLKCQGPSKEHFQLSHQGQPFTRGEMMQHLVDVVKHNNLQTQPQPDPVEAAAIQQRESSAGSSFEYTAPEDQVESFQEQKNKMFKKIEEEKKKRAAIASKQYLDELLLNPELLVGKRIEHVFLIEHVKVWIHGVVTGISSYKTDNLKTLFFIDYEDEDELKEYNLLSDLKKNELIVKD
eukprot:XP_011683568.1 PREDICTED: uncharacterized protein LOC105447354 isoform X1 [Strongylocentrotus purpuratus]